VAPGLLPLDAPILVAVAPDTSYTLYPVTPTSSVDAVRPG
jgi:hypothetical protein